MLPQHIHIVGDYLLRYGISIHEFISLPNNGLCCMSHFAYWKTQQTYITEMEGTDTDRLVIIGILNRGVTVWCNPDDIGKISLDQNEVVSGYSY